MEQLGKTSFDYRVAPSAAPRSLLSCSGTRASCSAAPQLSRLPLACRGCSLEDADYAQVYRDLAPFRKGGGVDEAMLHRLSGALPGTLLASLGGGAPVQYAGGDDTEKKFPAHAAFWRDLLGELTGHLPPIKILLNAFDEARR